ncbi:MAG: BrnA antitoxin family protein [Blastomonas sp.]|nr:BrnA antitoxin family protein [Blastomonas sp.]
MSEKWASAEELDRMFDEGEDMDEFIDWSSARRVNAPPKRVNIDFPAHVVAQLDFEAKRRGVSRQALVKFWIVERLDAGAKLDSAA